MQMRARTTAGAARGAERLGRAAAVCAALVGNGLAGAGPEDLMIIVDPGSADALHIANHYIAERGLPDANVLFMTPGATDHQTFVDTRLSALFGELEGRGLDETIDYILVAPGGDYRMDISSTIPDACFPVSHFAVASGYTMAFIADEVLGGVPVTTINRYFSPSSTHRAFDSSITWSGGNPSTTANARRYFIGAMLGYTGPRGNTTRELIDMIERSAQADGSFPAGTFYFMDNQNDPARNVRVNQFGPAVTALSGLGFTGEIIQGTLPFGRHDALGIMTGFAGVDIQGANMTILPGAFADHLTSFAGHFGTGSQTKMSRWIARGASGSLGAVEEPCNYDGKFPRAQLHSTYVKGATLGESYFRSALYVPFQMLLYGDPLTRPFAHIPQIQVPSFPAGAVSGSVQLTPMATTTHPSAAIDEIDLLIDGRPALTQAAGSTFTIDTTALTDGFHEVRFVAYDDTTLRTRGNWAGLLEVSNSGASVTMQVQSTSGNLGTLFSFDVGAVAVVPSEVRLTHAGRIVASAPGSSATLTLHGRMLGGGPATVTPEIRTSGGVIRGEPVELSIAPSGQTTGATPRAFSYTTDVPLLVQVIELPADFDDAYANATYEIVQGPAQATIRHEGGPFAVIDPSPTASGADEIRFRVMTTGGTSNTGTVALEYVTPCYADCDGNEVLDVFDFLCFQDAFVAMDPYADCDGNTVFDVFDFLCFQDAFVVGCP
jgi:hypothetical protein